MCMEIKAITEALEWLKNTNYTSAIFVTDSMSSLEEVKKNALRRLEIAHQQQQPQ